MKPALLLVDLQNDFLASAALQPRAEILIRRAAALLAECRERRIPVMHLRTSNRRDSDRRLPHLRAAGRWICEVGTSGHESPAALRPIEGEEVFHKSGFDSFADGGLSRHLSSIGCDAVILAGLHLHACVRAAATAALERHLSVSVAEDAVGSNDPVHAAASRRWLADRCVRFESTSALIARLDGRESSALVHRSPSRTEEVLFEVPIVTRDQVGAAVQDVRRAALAWSSRPLSVRLGIVEDIARRLEAAGPALAKQMAVEIGKPVRQGFEEMSRAVVNVRDTARRAAAGSLEKREGQGTVRYRPLGVVAIISPWNNPVAIPMGKIAPALIYGNAVVWKAAPAATGISRALMGVLEAAGLPEHCVQLVTGDAGTGAALAARGGVDAVSFTGSLAGGYSMQEICGSRMIPLQAELSGNNAAIVCDDADLEHAAKQVAWGAFAFAGQRCTANRRVILSPGIRARFLCELEMASAALPWGDPLEESTEIGPMISAERRDEVAAALEQAASESRTIVLPDRAQAGREWVRAGAYQQPAIVCCDEPGHWLVQEETMGPLLVVQSARDFEHSLELCNGVRHGLAAALFTRSNEMRDKFLNGAMAGVLKLNTSTAGADATLPFTGWKASGIGPPEHGEGDRLFYTRTQAVY